MGTMSKELRDRLSEFFVCEIGSNAMDGITYTLIIKNDKNKTAMQNIERYKQIRVEAMKCGYSDNEIFRVHEVSNGYVFDMDLSVAKEILAQLVKSIPVKEGEQPIDTNLTKDMPERRRKKDIYALAKYLKAQYDKGNHRVEVALFNKNANNRINVTGKGPKGENLMITFPAFALRHSDVEAVNEFFLIPHGFRVCSLQSCEILPSKNGVAFIFEMESMSRYEGNYNNW
jgi:hypothetical protein